VSPGIARYLTDRGIPFEVHWHAPIVTFEDAKAVLPFDPGLMVKGLAFGLPDGRVAIVALPAADRADYRKIARALGLRRENLRMASSSQLQQLDMEIGGIAPIPVGDAEVLVDRTVLDLRQVVCGTGRTNCSLVLAQDAFARLPVREVGDFSKLAG
jgi:Cys-tRNA(Pro)/Cys-tRNA(Cys) deacylase